jgi:CheY-like chemotaxis protein
MPTPLEVLLVEDSTSDARLIEHITAHVSAPIRITTANDCSGALARLSDVRFIPNLVIADMGVLEFGGVELLKRCNPRGIPVVVFSGSMNPTHGEQTLRLGAKELVRKPIQLDEYIEAVSTMIAKWARRDGACLGSVGAA